eukprot:1144367-Pelagomonas_calceolata.AAC.1
MPGHPAQTSGYKGYKGRRRRSRRLTASLFTTANEIMKEKREVCSFPELHRKHVQAHILKIIIQLVRNSLTPIYFYKVKPHAGIASNECADAITKHQAIQDNDAPADTTFPCANLQGSPLNDTTWLAFEEIPRTHANTSGRLNPTTLNLKHLSNLHDALRTHMHSKHRLGRANTNTGYYSFYQSTLFNQNTQCASKCPPACNAPSVGSLTVPFTSYQESEHHNIASTILLKGVSKSPLGAGIASMDIGRADRLTLQDLQIPEHATNRTLPEYIFPRLFPEKDRLTSSRPDAILGYNRLQWGLSLQP